MAEVQEAYDHAFLLADRNIIKLVAAVVLANQLEGPPVWMLIVASSSGGKSAILMTLDELEFIQGKRMTFFISDMTENTFASGFRSSTGDASLLMQLPTGGMLIFKDFTSLLTKRQEARNAIMGQLREVYDRKFDKRTGNNQNVTWKGKAGAIAGVTEAVHEYMSEMSVMGDRFIMYSMTQPDRLEATRFVMSMKTLDNSQERRIEQAKIAMHAYLRHALKNMTGAKLYMTANDQDLLIQVADFVTKVRSGVVEDERTGHVKFVPSAEMPIRLIDQLMSIGTALCHMNVVDGRPPMLSEGDMNLLFKIAFDSIPLKRRWALRQLATYAQGVSTSGLATMLNYETEVVKRWLAQLNALGIVKRMKGNMGADTWLLNPGYDDIMFYFEKVIPKNERLTGEMSQEEMLIDESLSDAF